MAVLPVGIGPAGGYQIQRSLRFNSADSAYLNRTFGTPTNNLKWTWSSWIKRSAAVDATIFSQGIGATNTYAHLYYSSTGELNFRQVNGSGTVVAAKTTTALYRDYSAWYHIILVYDSANATSTNRLLLYVNGVQITAFSSSTDPSLNLASYINSAAAHRISSVQYSPVLYYFDGYLTEVNFVDGQALTPSSFGQNNINTGVWEPIRYVGTYGTNGFYINFSDNSATTATTLGKDYSGNGNNWTPNNFSVAAGAGNDSLVDTPTPYGTDTGVGGEVRGNYATLNPLLVSTASFANGNLDGTLASGTASAVFAGTVSIPTTGKYYFEYTVNTASGDVHAVGIVQTSLLTKGTMSTDSNSEYATSVIYRSNGVIYKNTSSQGTYTAISNGDIIGIAVDVAAGTCGLYRNGSLILSVTSITSTDYSPFACKNPTGGSFSASFTFNAGQRPFAYTAPSGFKALCTQNLPTPAIGATSTTTANKYMNVVLWTGNSSTQTVTGVGFQPDLVWAKKRSGAERHVWFDAVRGAGYQLSSDLTAAETYLSNTLTSFTSDGFSNGNNGYTNESPFTYVAWNWNAGGSNATNTSGSITSTVRANTTAGFSIVTYTGTGANATVGHGLGVAPSMIICKNRDVARSWAVYHTSLGNTKNILLNSTGAANTSNLYWNNTSPTSSVFSVGSDEGANENTKKIVAYCFAAVAGYSAFGSYTGNGNADGVFVYLGFRPRFIFWKNASTTGDWQMKDAARSTYNVTSANLYANLSNAENSAGDVDFLSNGFKLRSAGTDVNGSGNTIIYAAFAESPFKYSLAR